MCFHLKIFMVDQIDSYLGSDFVLAEESWFLALSSALAFNCCFVSNVETFLALEARCLIASISAGESLGVAAFSASLSFTTVERVVDVPSLDWANVVPTTKNINATIVNSLFIIDFDLVNSCRKSNNQQA